MIKSKKQMYLVIGAFALVLMLGTVTYAFFNYTRTGSANTIRTGRIAFNSTQGQAINLTNVFPIDVSNGIPNDATKVGSVTINVTGDTTYGDGVEYLVSAVNVQNTVGSGANAKSFPISIDVSVTSNTGNDPATTLGTADSDYFTNRGANANTSIYKVLANDIIENNDQLVVGYIKSGATGVDGNIVIRAYLDASKIAISDTYPTEVVDTNHDGYLDRTPNSFGTGRTVFTTTEWNSLQTNGVSFQVKVEANEGVWVDEETTPTCPGPQCVYSFATGGNYPNSVISGDLGVDYYSNYEDVGKKYFLGYILGENNIIRESYACGINTTNDVVFCLRGGIGEDSEEDKEVYNDNLNRLQLAFTNINPTTKIVGTNTLYTEYYDTNSDIGGIVQSSGYVMTYIDSDSCVIFNLDGSSWCGY